jgi:hypothetical protein
MSKTKKKAPNAPRLGHHMTGAELTEALRLLEVPQTHMAAWTGIDPRTFRRYCNGEVPTMGPLAVLTRLMVARPELVPLVRAIGLGEAQPIALGVAPPPVHAEPSKRGRKVKAHVVADHAEAPPGQDIEPTDVVDVSTTETKTEDAVNPGAEALQSEDLI